MQSPTICPFPGHERHLAQRADRGYCMYHYSRLPRPPHWPAQHWSTRAPRLPSPAATIGETIHLPPGALEWASVLVTATCIIGSIVRSALISPECPRLIHICMCLDAYNVRGWDIDEGSGWGDDHIDIYDQIRFVAIGGCSRSYCVIVCDI